MLSAVATTVTLDMNTIILAVIGLLGTTVTGFLALRMATISADSKKAADNIEKIHVAVNSGKTAMENQIAGLQKLVLELSGTVKTLEENKRGAELAKALATSPAAAAVSPPATPLDKAIDQLTDAAKDTVVAADKTVDLAEKVPL